MSSVSVSILDCDFSKIKKNINNINKSIAKYIHIDIMDGFFVHRNTEKIFNIDKIKSLTDKKIDIHLMVCNPKKFILNLSKYNPYIISFHIESDQNINDNITLIKSYGIKCGIAINPDTELNKINKYLNKIDLILIMSVNPGKGGQKFKESTFQRLKLLKQKIIDSKLETKIEVDGGIDNSVSKKLNNLGADILVSGSYLIKNDSIKKGVNSLLKV
jgi:ribulose-phosphate 3-epimerase